jgi:hypothetical protein
MKTITGLIIANCIFLLFGLILLLLSCLNKDKFFSPEDQSKTRGKIEQVLQTHDPDMLRKEYKVLFDARNKLYREHESMFDLFPICFIVIIFLTLFNSGFLLYEIRRSGKIENKD